jgi:hypothetical protein
MLIVDSGRNLFKSKTEWNTYSTGNIPRRVTFVWFINHSTLETSQSITVSSEPGKLIPGHQASVPENGIEVEDMEMMDV